MLNFFNKSLAKIKSIFVTDSERLSEISETRDISAPHNRDTKPEKLVMDSLSCPYCQSPNFVKKGFRTKKREKVQLYQCLSCRKVFTPRTTRGKHYPLAIMLDAISIYNLGYSLEATCRIVRSRAGVAGAVENRSHLQPSTLAAWVAETEELCRFARMREFAMKNFSPKDIVITATLAHRQLYRYRFHRGKCSLIIQEEYGHRKFAPMRDFLELVPAECPHQYFSQGLRASEAPLTFSKTAMIVRGKTNYATRLAAFVLQSVTDRKTRHEAVQKFFLANDSVTIATEVPVYLTRDDMEHMKTQLGFQIFPKDHSQAKNDQFSKSNLQSNFNDSNPKQKKSIENSSIDNSLKIENCELKINELPKLITGHIDLLQIRNGQIHILDYKPNAERQRPIEQLTLYAMAVSRLTGLRLFEFKCAWFDEKDYFEFFPLHVLHKPKKARRRRNVTTQEGTYQVNKNEKKMETVRPNI